MPADDVFVSQIALKRTQAAIERLVLAGHELRLDALACAVGLSPGHFQREFSACVGLSPKRFAQVLAKERLLHALRADMPVLHAALEAGLSGPGRAHELLIHAEGATPAQARQGGRGMRITAGMIHTELGVMFAAWTGLGFCALEFARSGGPDEAHELQASLQKTWPNALWARDDAMLRARVRGALDSGGHATVHVHASHFRLRVWQALMQLPPNALVSYGGLARALGRPDAARAVAGAVAANPVAILIPCHRVIRESGELAGYRWGIARKAMLIAREQDAGSSIKARDGVSAARVGVAQA